MTTEEPMLEACPFCGSAAEQPFIGDAVECTNKDCRGFSTSAANWNTRVSRTPPVDQDEVERLREALTPSGDTKAAYMGEFSFQIELSHPRLGTEHRPVDVPWTTIKQIMAAIRERARVASIGSGAGDVREALRQALADMVRLADMGLEESLREPEENGNYAAYTRAKNLLAALSTDTGSGG